MYIYIYIYTHTYLCIIWPISCCQCQRCFFLHHKHRLAASAMTWQRRHYKVIRSMTPWKGESLTYPQVSCSAFVKVRKSLFTYVVCFMIHFINIEVHGFCFFWVKKNKRTVSVFAYVSVFLFSILHRENGGTLGMVPLIINPIYTFYGGYYWVYPNLKGSFGG